MYHNVFIHSSVDGRLGCFHVLTAVNSAAVNIGVHVSFSVSLIYVEYRKMVLMSLSAGQQWRCRHREQTCGHSEGMRGWDELRE